MKSVSANAKNYEAQFGLGQIYIYLQNLNDAEKCFELCKESSENYETLEVIKYLAYIYSRTKKKNFEANAEMFRKVLEFQPDDIDSHLELGNLLEFKKPKESLELFLNALELIKNKQEIKRKEQVQKFNLYNPEIILPEIYNNIASIKIRLELFENAEFYLNEAKANLALQLKQLSSEKLTDKSNEYKV